VLAHLSELLDEPDEFAAGVKRVRDHVNGTLKTPLAKRGSGGTA